MRLGWFFGPPDRIPPNDPCPKLSRATRRKCKDGLITEILSRLQNETDKDRRTDEETSDFLPFPGWGSVKVNFYRVYLNSTADQKPSSAFKELERSEFAKYPVQHPKIIQYDVDKYGGEPGDLGTWCGFLGAFASEVTNMAASDPSNKWLRPVSIPEPSGQRPFGREEILARLLEDGYTKANGHTQTWQTLFILADSSNLMRGAIIEGKPLYDKVDSKGDYPRLYQCELLALLVCLLHQEKYLRDHDAPTTMSAFVISGGVVLRIVEAQVISPTEIRFIQHHESDKGSTGETERTKAASWALSTPIE